MTYPGAGRMLWAAVAVVLPLLAGHGGARADDAVMMWNDDMVTAAIDTSILLTDGPPEIANQMAMLDTAMFNAVNAASGMPYQGYDYSGGAVADASADAAALAAGYGVLSSVFNAATWTTALNAAQTGGALTKSTVDIPTLESQIDTAFGTVMSLVNTDYTTALAALTASVDPTALANGLALGAQQATDILDQRAADGSITAIINGLNNNAPVGSGTVAGVYIPPSATPGGRPEMFPEWDIVSPWAISPATMASDVTGIAGPPPLDSPAYANALLEVECEGVSTTYTLPAATQAACTSAGYGPETAAQTAAALFWNDPGGTATPPGHWLDIADTVLTDEDVTDELQQARLTAMLSTAEADAGTAAWTVKYQDNLWRPVTAITTSACDSPNADPSDGDDAASWNPYFTTCDPDWSSEIATPPHPDYVAGHPAFSGAGAAVLESFFGTNDIGFCSTSDAYMNDGSPVDPITECFDSFSDAGTSAEFSRVAGGIHTPFAVEDAFTLGSEVGGQAVLNDAFAPVPEPASALLLAPAIAMAARLRGRRRL